MRKKIIFELSAFEDFRSWAKLDRKIYRRIITILKHLERSSPIISQHAEPLKRELNGYWSIKINREHRLVYKVTNTKIIIIACKYY
ncbi:Toxin YoeB [Hyella patelloides LEGE 07179]|uniref:Endoribonuclease YoeB n=1 Tax=Hyella patelloides LEGE 07179 TaxID=945734 RepID=A0A563VT38_9CYAN|nr:Txe/YoeB family addiction module toxin [Hyella patelloides]VEP14632.1 Toxin YoeB [Hyella patelloides LEGE 07179]